MRSSRSPLLRMFSIFIALVLSSFLTGCGGGGGGIVGNGPVGPLPTSGSTVEGFVRLSSGNAALREAGSAANQSVGPLIGASCELFAFDAGGREHKIADAVTNEQGFYRFTGVINPYGSRNLVIRARLQGGDLEGILSILRDGAILRAPTIDADSGLQVALVRHAARSGRQTDLNLGELFSLLPPKALAALEKTSSLTIVVEGFLARQEARRRKLGAAADTLGAYAFELQQTLQEMIERGEASAEEAWSWFDRKLSLEARKLGVSEDQQVVIDTLDQALVFEPAAKALETSSVLGEDLDGWKTERLRERKLRLLEAVTASMKTLVGDDPAFVTFFKLVENLEVQVQQCSTAGELHRLLKDSGQGLVEFSEALALALRKVRFTPDLVARVLATPIPQLGLAFVGGADGSNNVDKLLVEEATAGSPLQFASDFLDREEAVVVQLIENVKAIASSIGLQLTADEMKAIAWLILVQSPEHLNVPQPPMPENPVCTVSGSLEPLPGPKEVDGVSFTHQLVARATVAKWNSDGTVAPGIAPEARTLAWLGAEGPVEVTKITADGGKSVAKLTLAELGGVEHVEVYGRVLARESSGETLLPMLPVKVPAAAIALTPRPFPAPTEPEQQGTSQAGSEGSAGGTDAGVSSPAEPGFPTAAGAWYLVVERIVVLPPPAPAPETFTGLQGRVVQVEALGRPLPGLFVLETTDPASPCQGAVLRSASKDLESNRFIRLTDWAGKYVTLSGTLVRELDSRCTLLVAEIAERQ